ncbi:unannotated protein [freshwater metagenome]|uniref:Unannotated protein n=1 Tax=freshwater metagenome TaxID=449393 RepID=A0A6J7HT23_9ZZZZ
MTAAPKRRTPGWVPVLIGVLAFLVVLVGFGLAAGDWVSRNSEMNSLVTRIEASEAAMQQTQDELALIFAEYDEPPALTTQEKAEFADKLKAAAAAGEQRVAAAGAGVRAVVVMPWHGNISAGQKAYVVHNQAWQDYLRASAKDPAVLLDDQPAINETFMASEPLLKKAVPEPPLYDLNVRVDDIFVEGQAPAEEGPTQEALLRGVR